MIWNNHKEVVKIKPKYTNQHDCKFEVARMHKCKACINSDK